MDGLAQFPRLGALFAEDFDRPPAAAEAAPAEPVYTAGELAAAREVAWQEGREAGLGEAAASDAAALAAAMTAIGEQLAATREAASAEAEGAADGIARLLLDALAASFPVLCARYGDAEVRAIVRSVLPALFQEPAITVRAHPRTAAAIAQELARLDPDIAARVHMTDCDAMPPGDVRIVWRSGTATRDAAALWQQVAAVLAPAGLLRADAAILEKVDAG
jgi:flagellar assembly protein FliH